MMENENKELVTHLNFDGYDSLENLESITITSDYWQPAEGESITGYFVGFDEIEVETGLLKVAQIATKTRIVITASAQVVSTLAKLPFKTPVRITYLGVKKTRKNFKMNSFKIEVLYAR